MLLFSVLIILVNSLIVCADFDSGDNDFSSMESHESLLPGLRQSVGKKCFRDIGCFSGEEFRKFKKGALLPLSPDSIRPEFRIYSSGDSEEEHTLKYNPTIADLNKTRFNPKYRTIVVVHGFRSSIEEWMIEMKNLVFSQIFNEYNVILVGWARGSKINSYFLAVANTKVVGALIAFFINRLCELFDIRNNNFHLIGHSLGAHVVGFAGKRLFNPQIDLITALDPAGPGFAKGYPSLERTDAKRVVVIHTDIGKHQLTEGLGNLRLLGDVDFFPNGGSLQPGCAHAAGIRGTLVAISNDQAISCSHQRGYDLATSLGEPGQYCLPVGYECPDWETFLEGRCADCGQNNTKCHLMGVYFWYWRGIHYSEEDKRDIQTKRYYLNTGALEDYCLFHYQIALHMKDDSSVSSGYLGIKIDGKIHKRFQDITIERKLSETRPGYIHTLLFTMKYKLEGIRSISIKWSTDHTISNSDNQQTDEEKVLNIQFVEFNFMSHIYKKDRDTKSVIFCPIGGEGIVGGDDEILDFVKCEDNNKPKEKSTSLSSDQLHPITDFKDIMAVDYNMIDKVAHKLSQTNILLG